MKFYSIIIKYRLYIGLALIVIGVLTNVYAGFWPAFLPYLVLFSGTLNPIVMPKATR